MPLPFSGAARPLGAADMQYVATLLGCDLPAVQAVLTVETGGCGGFLSDGSGRPRILFEAHKFSAATEGRHDETHPGISSPSWNRKLYKGGAGEYLRLEEAVGLDRAAALKSASWGMFQVLGANCRACGFADVEEFVAAMAESEFAQLQAFGVFVLHAGLAPVLRVHDWAAFAEGYNGARYRENQYDSKLAVAYAEAVERAGATAARQVQAIPTSSVSAVAMLRIGARGPAVKRLQSALNRHGADLALDGAFGRATEIAVEKFQIDHRLVADGVVGPKTVAAFDGDLD